MARHFGTIDLLVVHLLFLQRLSVNPPPILCLTAGSLVRLPYSDDDDVSDDSVHLAEPSRAPSPELICPSQPGLRAARQTRVTSSHQEGLHAPYGVVIALFPSDLWRVAFDRTLSWRLAQEKADVEAGLHIANGDVSYIQWQRHCTAHLSASVDSACGPGWARNRGRLIDCGGG